MIGVPASRSENVLSTTRGDGRGENSEANRDREEEEEMRDGSLRFFVFFESLGFFFQTVLVSMRVK